MLALHEIVRVETSTHGCDRCRTSQIVLIGSVVLSCQVCLCSKVERQISVSLGAYVVPRAKGLLIQLYRRAAHLMSEAHSINA